MELFQDGWEFSLHPLHTTLEQAVTQDLFTNVGIPHDWLIYHTADLYADGTGWYRKRFFWEPAGEQMPEKQRVFLRFDGIYMDSRVYVNRQQAFEWKYGYSAFEFELTPFLKEGENEILVSVDYQSPNSRWYSGAGIYRNVWIRYTGNTYLAANGIYCYTELQQENTWNVTVETEISGWNETEHTLEFRLYEKKTGKILETAGQKFFKLSQKEDGLSVWRWEAEVKAPHEWDITAPFCYELEVQLKEKGTILQIEKQTIGFRTIAFTADQGFFLNHRSVKLNGVCEHHDLGCLGSAFHKQAMKRKFRILKEMGVNAVRLTHNMPAQEVMELADEMGILIVSEAFDMWELPKTAYDYGRFFPQWYERDVASWIRRDRNHPSLIMWSIGNEIYDTHVSERGKMWMELLMKEVEKHDPAHRAAVTMGSNYMPWENTQKCADVIKLIGYNYGEKYYEDHHAAHPDWIIYGSETSSVVSSRGIYHFPYKQSVLADEDEQCSSLGNSTTSWGARSAEACIMAERDHPYSCGQFLWTGFDYIGEPTPYHTRNSYFGQIDTAGFPKDAYYIYQAEWTDVKTAPMIHLFPYWDFNEGQKIDIRAYTNATKTELFLNGVSQGVCQIDHAHGTILSGNWQVPYTPGEIRAVAYDAEGNVIAEDVHHSFGDSYEIILKADKRQLKADGEDLLFLEIMMKDEQGYPVENANDRVFIQVEGSGALVGCDNGDSTDTDSYKCGNRRLFSGKLLAVIKAGTYPGTVKITVTSEGKAPAGLEMPVKEARIRSGISEKAYLAEPLKKDDSSILDFAADIPVRTIRLASEAGCILTPENPKTRVTAKICPEHASDQEVIWMLVDDAGIPSKLASYESEGQSVILRAKSDGCFRLRCMSRCGTEKIRIISQLEFVVTGFGKAYKDPYEFISGGLYDYSRGSIGNGNEHGIATARDGESQVGFHELDFGTYGSDEICIPIFALTGDPYRIRIYEGMPEEAGSELVADVIYQKPSIWNVYQEETFQLKKRLKGITSLCFVLENKVHIKGFSFTKKNRAEEKQNASDCDRIYGDSFCRDGTWIRGIGNNVTLEFQDMTFEEDKDYVLTIFGKTELDKNTIVLCLLDGEKEERQILEFRKGEGAQPFVLKPIKGTQNVRFLFLPGSNFDFAWFRFECQKE